MSTIITEQNDDVLKYKICSSTLTDSDVAAIFFAIAFIFLVLGLGAYAWWGANSKKKA